MGAHAVSTEEGSSASQVTAAKVMDVTARLPDCDGQADAVSACTQVKMEDATRLLRIPKSECPYIYMFIFIDGYVFHGTSGQNLGHTMKIQWFLLNEICSDTHLLASCGRDISKKYHWDLDGKSTELGVSVCSSETKIVLVGTRG